MLQMSSITSACADWAVVSFSLLFLKREVEVTSWVRNLHELRVQIQSIQHLRFGGNLYTFVPVQKKLHINVISVLKMIHHPNNISVVVHQWFLSNDREDKEVLTNCT